MTNAAQYLSHNEHRKELGQNGGELYPCAYPRQKYADETGELEAFVLEYKHGGENEHQIGKHVREKHPVGLVVLLHGVFGQHRAVKTQREILQVLVLYEIEVVKKEDDWEKEEYDPAL